MSLLLSIAQLALAQRTALDWGVPRAELEAALGKEGATHLNSQPVYSAGVGWRLLVQVSKAAEGGKRDVGVFLEACDYSHGALQPCDSQ